MKKLWEHQLHVVTKNLVKAQSVSVHYLSKFYQSVGFMEQGESSNVDRTPHIEMLIS